MLLFILYITFCYWYHTNREWRRNKLMKQRKIIIIILLIAAILGIMIYGKLSSQPRKDSYTNEEVAKMLTYLKYSPSELKALKIENNYKDLKEKDLVTLYANASKMAGFDIGEKKKFKKNHSFTYLQGKRIARKYHISEEELSFALDQAANHKPMKIKEWNELYDCLRTKVKNNTVEKKTVIVFKTAKDQLETSIGVLQKDEIDKKVALGVYEIYTVENQFIMAGEQSKEKITLHNVWIKKESKKSVTLYVEGSTVTYPCKRKSDETIERQIADVVLEDNKIIEIHMKPERVKAKVLSVTKDAIELEQYGKVPISEYFKIYNIYGTLSMEDTKSILAGYKNIEFVLAKDKIEAAVITQPMNTDMIRVALNTTGYQGLLHEKVVVTSDSDFILTCGKKKKTYKAGKKVTILTKNKLLLSIERSSGSPSYRGSLFISKKDGKLVVVNELLLEEYLYAVVPSEMPVSYGTEALKVQAICARSYAYSQMKANKYAEYGAQVDDSVNSQVYNNTSETKETIFAVKDTYGEALFYNDKVITAYFFSTSCGVTSDAKDVWQSETNQSPEYLTGSYQGEEDKNYDLSEEAAFRSFINEPSKDCYEKDCGWYRWKVTLPIEQIEGYVSNIGKIKDIKVVERGKSGILKEIKIIGEDGTKEILGEYNIRATLSPAQANIEKQDGTKVSGQALLPSGYFYINKGFDEEGELSKITLKGGGYGHGVGMSQNGVKVMTDLGYSAKEILKHYYSEVTIKIIY